MSAKTNSNHPESLAMLLEAFSVACCNVRLRIILFLAGGPRDVTEIARWIGKSEAQTSRYLTSMAQAEFVDYVQEGRYHRFHLCGRAQVKPDPPTIELDGGNGNSLTIRLSTVLFALIHAGDHGSVTEVKPPAPPVSTHALRDGALKLSHRPSGR